MRRFVLTEFSLNGLRAEDGPTPQPGPGELLLDVRAISLNYRDLLVIRGQYNPKLKLPAVPISDGAGVVAAVGPGVTDRRVGDRVVSHFISGWLDGPFRGDYPASTLGLPGPGLAAEQVVLPAHAVLPIPSGYDFAQAATLPIAALTAWSALVSLGRVQAGHSVLTLGTGGVSIFALQLSKALGARVFITSSSDEKLERARQLGADEVINYRTNPGWDRVVLERTGGVGVDRTVENAGAATLNQSIRATRAGGIVAFLGALTGLEATVNLAAILMKRIHLAGVMVDSRAAFVEMNRFLAESRLQPVIDRRFEFAQLPEALRALEGASHFGKIVLTRGR